MEKITTKKFELPLKLKHDLYEASGAANKYKGYILIVSDERGDTFVHANAEAGVVYSGLIRDLEKWVALQALEE